MKPGALKTIFGLGFAGALLYAFGGKKQGVEVQVGEATIEPNLVFPVDTSGKPNFGPTFSAPRPGGRKHNGVDIFATEGTPVRAVVDGSVTFGTNKLGGNIANLTTADATWYYYAHLSGYEGVSRTVRAGEVIGYVGHTGNASQTPSHLHFEIHPNGGDPIDPFPILKEIAPHGSVTT